MDMRMMAWYRDNSPRMREIPHVSRREYVMRDWDQKAGLMLGE
jgi:hypothetical protein